MGNAIEVLRMTVKAHEQIAEIYALYGIEYHAALHRLNAEYYLAAINMLSITNNTRR